jgi:GYF domain 2
LPAAAVTSESEQWWWGASPDGTLQTIDGRELREKLSNGELPARLLVWRTGWAEWLHASQVSELVSAVPVSERRFPLRPKLDAQVTDPPPAPLEKYARYDASMPKRTLLGMPAANSGSSTPPPKPPRPRTLLSSAAPVAPAARPRTNPPPPPQRGKSNPPPAPQRGKSNPPPAPQRSKSMPPPPPQRAKSTPPPPPRAKSTPPPPPPIDLDSGAELDVSELVSVDALPVAEPLPIVPIGDVEEHALDLTPTPSLGAVFESAPVPSSEDSLPRFDLPSEAEHERLDVAPAPPWPATHDAHPMSPSAPPSPERVDAPFPSSPPPPRISQRLRAFLRLSRRLRAFAQLSQRLRAFLQSADKRQRLVMGIVGGAAALLLVALLVHALSRSKRRAEQNSPRLNVALHVAATRPSVAPRVPAAEKTQAPPAPPAQQSAAASCTLAKDARRLARSVQVNVPLYAADAPGSERVAIGFASASTSAVGGTLDPSSLHWSPEHERKGPRTVLGVVPLTASGKLHFAVDRSGSPLDSAHTVDANPPFIIGAYQGGIARVLGYGDPEPIWPNANADAITEPSVAEASGGYAVTFRRNHDVAVGWLTTDGKRKTDLGVLSEPGGHAGTPHVAVGDNSVLVTFAMKKNDDAHFGVALAKAKLGEVPSRMQSFSVPAGGPGGDAISPAAIALDGGRWLLQWTEGASGEHVVRVQTLSAELDPIGAPITVSPKGADSGQGTIVARGGHAAALFLVRNGQDYELWAASLACP